MYAVIETGGKQYQVSEGDVLFVEKLDVAADETFSIEKVVAVSDDGGLKTGSPYLKGAKVEAKVLKHGKGKKITVFTYRPKKDYKRKLGHRQPYTQIRIESIQAGK